MDAAFDLNIDNYTIDELEDFFMLGGSAGVPIYDTTNVEHKKKMLCDKLTSNSDFTPALKSQIKSFLDLASHRIVVYLNGSSGGNSGSIGNSGSNSSSGNQQLYNPYSSAAPLSMTQSSQAGSAAFNSAQNTVVQQGGHFLIQNPSAMNQGRSSSSNATTTNNAAGGLSLQSASTDFQGTGTGTVNPIQRRTIKRALNIDTRFRPNYNSTRSTDIQISLPYRFEKVIGLRVAAVELPLTYYAVSAEHGNNVFRVDWTDGGGSAQHCAITLPDGNYETEFTSSADTSNTTIESAINALLLDSPAGIAPLFLRYTVNRTSARSIFAQAATDGAGGTPAQVPFKITFNSDSLGRIVENATLSLYLGWSLGFRAAAYNRDAAVGFGPIVSEGTCCIRGPQYAFVAIDDYNNSVNNYFISAYKDSVSSPNVVARLNLSQMQQNGQVYQMGQDDGVSSQLDFRSRSYFGPVDIQKMRVTIFDEFGRVLNLNNMDWSMAIMFECMYE